MLKRILFLTVASFGLICSELDVGTDIDKIGNVVLDGVVQTG